VDETLRGPLNFKAYGQGTQLLPRGRVLPGREGGTEDYMICLPAGRLLDEFKLGRESSRLEVRAVVAGAPKEERILTLGRHHLLSWTERCL